MEKGGQQVNEKARHLDLNEPIPKLYTEPTRFFGYTAVFLENFFY
jgi:hypothetical protein